MKNSFLFKMKGCSTVMGIKDRPAYAIHTFHSDDFQISSAISSPKFIVKSSFMEYSKFIIRIFYS